MWTVQIAKYEVDPDTQLPRDRIGDVIERTADDSGVLNEPVHLDAGTYLVGIRAVEIASR